MQLASDVEASGLRALAWQGVHADMSSDPETLLKVFSLHAIALPAVHQWPLGQGPERSTSKISTAAAPSGSGVAGTPNASVSTVLEEAACTASSSRAAPLCSAGHRVTLTRNGAPKFSRGSARTPPAALAPSPTAYVTLPPPLLIKRRRVA